MVAFEHMAAGLYLAAGVAAILGLVLPAPRLLRGASWVLGLGAVSQAVAFATLHRLDPAPSLTDLGQAIAVAAWLAVIFTLVLLTRFRLMGFVAPLAFIAFLATFGAMLSHPGATAGPEPSGSIPHAHILLASAGFAALGIAALAGLFFLLKHRALKRRRNTQRWLSLPSLEALDRVNRVALVLGFPLLTLGVLTGLLWLHARAGEYWSGSLHETWTLIAWMIYLALVVLRFPAHQGAREAAASAVAGFAFLLIAVIGVGLVS